MLDLKPGQRFYVGSRDMASGRSVWPITDMESAIGRAKKACIKTRDTQIVVEVVAIIYTEAPVVVTRLKEEVDGRRRTTKSRARGPKRRISKRVLARKK